MKKPQLGMGESVEGTEHRCPGGRPRGKLRRILRSGCGEIWTGAQQLRETILGPRTQLVRE